jgi:hypothetical protein
VNNAAYSLDDRLIDAASVELTIREVEVLEERLRVSP